MSEIKALLEGFQLIYSKNYIAQGRVLIQDELSTVLDKTSFQGYRQFLLVYSLSHTIPYTLKI